MRKPKCRCGHALSWHSEFGTHGDRPCLTNRCMNVCHDYAPVPIVPKPGERPVFGVHRVPDPWDEETA